MTILAVSHEYPPIGGGGANAAWFLLHGFAKAGHKVTLVTANYGGQTELEQEEGLTIHRVNCKRAHAEHCSFVEMLDYLRKALPLTEKLEKEQHFDLCLVFFGIPAGPIGYRLKKKYKLPYIIRFGGGDIPGFQERFTKVYKLIAPAIKAIWKHADYRIANSEGLRQLAYEFCDKYPFEVVPNGVDTELFCPAEKVQEAENAHVQKSAETASITSKYDILFVSRLIERKGLQHIIPKLPELQQKVGHTLRLTIVGDGPYRQTLEELARRANGENPAVEICFEGQKNKSEIVPYYQSADVFILPSAKEGMPNVVLEAMACGLPIVMTPCQGSSELIAGNGYVCPTDEFTDRLAELGADETLRIELSQKSRLRAQETFGWEATISSYITYIEKVK